jgi:hypothetical protein
VLKPLEYVSVTEDVSLAESELGLRGRLAFGG